MLRFLGLVLNGFTFGLMKVFLWNQSMFMLAKKNLKKYGTKIWITKNGHCSKAHNKSKIPEATLNNIIRIIEMRIPEIETKWKKNIWSDFLLLLFRGVMYILPVYFLS